MCSGCVVVWHALTGCPTVRRPLAQGGVAGICAMLREEVERTIQAAASSLQAATAAVEAKHSALEGIRRNLVEEEACTRHHCHGDRDHAPGTLRGPAAAGRARRRASRRAPRGARGARRPSQGLRLMSCGPLPSGGRSGCATARGSGARTWMA